jgi:hypothetical protein
MPEAFLAVVRRVLALGPPATPHSTVELAATASLL